MSRRDHFLSLRDDQPHVLPSLLAADFGNLEREVRAVEQAGARGLHLDVMDGHFVPNLSFGLPVVAAVRRLTQLPLDVHLMICEPQRYVTQFFEAGADCLTVHIEGLAQPRSVLQQIRELGAAAGLTLNPDTPVAALGACWDLCDLVLIMSVDAGFGGQQFEEVAVDKLRETRQAAGPDVLLEVDGGVNASTIGRCAAAGAQLFVAGSAVFRSADYGHAMEELHRLATSSF